LDRQFYHTGQFADKASVTLRTLRYYDQVGLLSPSQYTEAGHRLYTDEDLVNLQQILALKFLGLSLEEIKVYLQTEPQRFQDALAQQKTMMREKRAQLDTIIQAIGETETLLRTDQCTWEDIVNVIQVIQMEQKSDWHEKYFTPEQQQKLKELSKMSYSEEAAQKLKTLHPRPWTEEDQKRIDDQYTFLASELTHLVAAGADPASSEAQALARLKSELVYGFTRGDPDIEASVAKVWENNTNLPEGERPLKLPYGKEEAEFLSRAEKIYWERQK
jgi:DNA-binding transcriptional MerR regulator